MLIEKTFRFEASHQIANHKGKCARLHGHSWVMRVAVEGKMNRTTKMVIDFYDVKQIVQPIVDRLDHQHLGFGYHAGVPIYNSVINMPMEFLPTSENLLFWIADQLPEDFPWSYIVLDETCTSSALLEKSEWINAKTLERRTYARQTSIEEREEDGEKGRQENAGLYEEEGQVSQGPPASYPDDDIPY